MVYFSAIPELGKYANEIVEKLKSQTSVHSPVVLFRSSAKHTSGAGNGLLVGAFRWRHGSNGVEGGAWVLGCPRESMKSGSSSYVLLFQTSEFTFTSEPTKSQKKGFKKMRKRLKFSVHIYQPPLVKKSQSIFIRTEKCNLWKDVREPPFNFFFLLFSFTILKIEAYQSLLSHLISKDWSYSDRHGSNTIRTEPNRLDLMWADSSQSDCPVIQCAENASLKPDYMRQPVTNDWSIKFSHAWCTEVTDSYLVAIYVILGREDWIIGKIKARQVSWEYLPITLRALHSIQTAFTLKQSSKM